METSHFPQLFMNPAFRPKRSICTMVILATAMVATAQRPSGIAPPEVVQNQPSDPASELAAFKIAEGFEVGLFASEKDGIANPIASRFDRFGRLWVIGSFTYPQIKPGEEPNDYVRVLEDTDGDGKADKSTVFADKLMIPT